MLSNAAKDFEDDDSIIPSTPLKWLWITFVVIFIDQITKWTAEGSLELLSA